MVQGLGGIVGSGPSPLFAIPTCLTIRSDSSGTGRDSILVDYLCNAVSTGGWAVLSAEGNARSHSKMQMANTGRTLEETKQIVREFSKALLGQDELGVIIRAHIYIESEIDEYLKFSLHNYEQLERIEYSMKVRIALACGLREDLKAPLNALGKMRNKFAHNLGTTLTAADADNFYNTLGKVEKADVGQALKAMQTSGEKAVSLRTMPPKGQMAIYVVTLWGALASARNIWEPQSLFD